MRLLWTLALVVAVSAAPADVLRSKSPQDGVLNEGALVQLDTKTIKKKIPFYYSSQQPAQWNSITLAIQGDLTRVSDRLKKHADTWLGPISVCVLVPEGEADRIKDYLAAVDKDSNIKKYSDVHVVTADVGASSYKYPINLMRNCALENVLTEFAYLLDMDENTVFAELDMRQEVENILDANPGLEKSKMAVVVTSWQWGLDGISRDYPHNRDELQTLRQAGKVKVKHPEFTKAYLHPKLGFEEWVGLEQARQLTYVDDYEPYLIVTSKDCPKFDERFVGFGFNHRLHDFTLAINGYSFWAMPRKFTFSDDTPSECKKTASKWKDADKSLGESAWRELGKDKGCNNCGPDDCIMHCPWLVQKAGDKPAAVASAASAMPKLPSKAKVDPQPEQEAPIAKSDPESQMKPIELALKAPESTTDNASPTVLDTPAVTVEQAPQPAIVESEPTNVDFSAVDTTKLMNPEFSKPAPAESKDTPSESQDATPEAPSATDGAVKDPLQSTIAADSMPATEAPAQLTAENAPKWSMTKLLLQGDGFPDVIP